tara:strand:+ start:819 stop:1283 length:465 start_codon:yes stop_codon:yes gene_type:complete
MGTKRIGLARIEALIENLSRDLAVGSSTIISGAKGIQFVATARTATAAGLTTGTIADGTSFVAVTSGGANNIIILPTPTPGTVVWLSENAGTTGFELRTSAPATVGINAGTASNGESAIAGAITLVRCVCVSATNWVCTQFDADGDESKVEAAA